MNNQTIVNREEQINTAFSTSDFYQLLSTSLQLPTSELAEALLDGSYKADVLTILTELSCSEEDILKVENAFSPLQSSFKDAQDLLEEMRMEHTRLFYHPKKPAIDIYETTFLKAEKEGSEKPMLFVSQEALQVEKCYKEAGLIIKTREPADHIVTELEFMMDLYGKKALAMRTENTESLEKIEKQISHFEEQHLGKWGYNFFASLETEATILSYQLIGTFAKVGLGQLLPSK